MKLSTKSLLSSLVSSIVNATPSRYRLTSQREERRWERILEKHDRKGELRAAVLGIDPFEFRKKWRAHSLAAVVRSRGFPDERAFYRAVIPKIHDELRRRGWTARRIEQFEASKLRRVTTA